MGVTFQFYSLRRESFPMCVAVCSLLYKKLFFLPGGLLFVDLCVAWSVVCFETSIKYDQALHHTCYMGYTVTLQYTVHTLTRDTYRIDDRDIYDTHTASKFLYTHTRVGCHTSEVWLCTSHTAT